MIKDGLKDVLVGASKGEIKTGEQILDERLRRAEEALKAQGSINFKLIGLVSDLTSRLEVLEGNRQKSALILPPRLDS